MARVMPEPHPENPAMALNWATYGKPTFARKGAVAVMRRWLPGRGHVGIVEECDEKRCLIVSGNGRGSKVDRKWYRQTRIIAFRWPL